MAIRAKGWGALAKELGIKPGSKEFKALKDGSPPRLTRPIRKRNSANPGRKPGPGSRNSYLTMRILSSVGIRTLSLAQSRRTSASMKPVSIASLPDLRVVYLSPPAAMKLLTQTA